MRHKLTSIVEENKDLTGRSEKLESRADEESTEPEEKEIASTSGQFRKRWLSGTGAKALHGSVVGEIDIEVIVEIENLASWVSVMCIRGGPTRRTSGEVI